MGLSEYEWWIIRCTWLMAMGKITLLVALIPLLALADHAQPPLAATGIVRPATQDKSIPSWLSDAIREFEKTAKGKDLALLRSYARLFTEGRESTLKNREQLAGVTKALVEAHRTNDATPSPDPEVGEVSSAEREGLRFSSLQKHAAEFQVTVYRGLLAQVLEEATRQILYPTETDQPEED